MRVHNPNIGEIVDRITILAKKIGYCESKGLGSAHFKAERDELDVLLRQKIHPKKLTFVFATEAEEVLSYINGRIWDVIEELRDPETTDFETARLGREALALNDFRAAVIGSVNALYRINTTGQEKPRA